MSVSRIEAGLSRSNLPGTSTSFNDRIFIQTFQSNFNCHYHLNRKTYFWFGLERREARYRSPSIAFIPSWMHRLSYREQVCVLVDLAVAPDGVRCLFLIYSTLPDTRSLHGAAVQAFRKLWRHSLYLLMLLFLLYTFWSFFIGNIDEMNNNAFPLINIVFAYFEVQCLLEEMHYWRFQIWEI